MPRVANPYSRVTEVASFVNASWKDYWYKSIEKGTKENPIGLIEMVAGECVNFAAKPHSAEEWKAFLADRTAIKEAERIGRESTDFGKAVHSIVEAFLLEQPLPKVITLEDKYGKEYTRGITEREYFSGGLLINWCKEANVNPIMLGGKPAIETSLQSETHKLTGHPDLVCTFGCDPTIWIVDWKTSKDFRLEYKLQLAAYTAMIKEQFNVIVNAGVIVRVPSDPNVVPQFQTHEVHNLDKYFEAFLSCFDAMRFFKNKGRWREAKEAA